jgi:hypothetical protein
MPTRALIIDDSLVMRKIAERSPRQATIDLSLLLPFTPEQVREYVVPVLDGKP